MASKHNDATITRDVLIFLLDHLPEGAELYIGKDYQLRWLPTDDNGSGGVVDFSFYGGALVPNDDYSIFNPVSSKDSEIG